MMLFNAFLVLKTLKKTTFRFVYLYIYLFISIHLTFCNILNNTQLATISFTL